MAVELNLRNKTVLITGVSSGIGAGVARFFAQAGAAVSGCGLDNEDSPGARQFLSHAGSVYAQALYTRADMTQAGQPEMLVDRTIEKFGRLDVLVSNAGANVFRGAADCTEADWSHNMELNLTAHWRLARLCKPHLEKERGVIILMASNHAYTTMPGCFPYNVAKTALTGLVRALALEWGPAIRTLGLAPGYIETPASEAWFDSFPDPDGERERVRELHSVKRLGTPDDVGAYCVFLASEYAGFISGTTCLLDGGRSAVMEDQ